MKQFLLMMVLACGLASCATSPQQEVRRIGLNWSDSRCIGNPVTPLCAVETWLACWSRKQDSLCEMVAPSLLKNVGGAAKEAFNLEYRIVVNKRLTKKNLTEVEKGVFLETIAPGYHLIMTDLKSCPIRHVNCEGKYEWLDFTGYSLKKIGKKWMIQGDHSQASLM